MDQDRRKALQGQADAAGLATTVGMVLSQVLEDQHSLPQVT